MRDTIRYTTAAAIALLMTVALSAQGQPTEKPHAAGSTLAATDRTFLMTAGQGGHAEVELANLATKKASNAEVKTLAQQLARDHSANNKELKSLAAAKHVNVPDSMDAEHRQLETRLQKLSGASFDKDYTTAMVDGHKKMIALFEEAANSSDAQIKAFADKTLPTLREHLTHAQKAQAAVGGSTSTSGTENPPAPTSAPK